MAITAPDHNFALPADAIRLPDESVQLDQKIGLRGFKSQPGAQSLAVELYWQTDEALTTRYTVFAQLLAGDNTVVAQSDSAPAGGTRPTTGWLPGEIITDPHTLSLPSNPSPGPYRLIAGLYDPVTGQRLPVRAADGTPVADFITVIPEVALP